MIDEARDPPVRVQLEELGSFLFSFREIEVFRFVRESESFEDERDRVSVGSSSVSVESKLRHGEKGYEGESGWMRGNRCNDLRCTWRGEFGKVEVVEPERQNVSSSREGYSGERTHE